MKLSVAIPCYEMNNMGREMLQYSLDILKTQDYQDFEVVVSDHSINDEIYEVCEREGEYLDIHYYRNPNKRGSSSNNINNAIVHCSGDLIKILCQDDYMFGSMAIRKTIENFDYSKKWLVSSYFHTEDRENFYTCQIPRLSSDLCLRNLIGTHSCLTIINGETLLFDENLIWYMDSEYYYRLFMRFGIPKILKDPTVVQLLWSGQVTNTLISRKIIRNEHNYILNKHGRTSNKSR